MKDENILLHKFRALLALRWRICKLGLKRRQFKKAFVNLKLAPYSKLGLKNLKMARWQPS